MTTSTPTSVCFDLYALHVLILLLLLLQFLILLLELICMFVFIISLTLKRLVDYILSGHFFVVEVSVMFLFTFFNEL